MAAAADVRFLRPRDVGFPASLDECDPTVAGLWVTGADPTSLGPMVAIVGARNATSYGLDVARLLAADLASNGVCVVSGMARGIDAAAHEGALSVEGKTVAVLACGVDVPYPASHTGLYRRILGRGSVVSEHPPGTTVHRGLFAERNRIIAGLSDGVLLVQARADKSGSKTTLEAAGRLGRTIFAVPGDIRSDLSKGPHEAIFDGAVMCTGVGDILEALSLGTGEPEDAPIPIDLPPEQRAMLVALNAGPARADELGARASLDVVASARALGMLELSGFALRDARGTYRRRR